MTRNHTHQGVDNELTSLGQVLCQQGTSHVTAQGVLEEGDEKRGKKEKFNSDFLPPSQLFTSLLPLCRELFLLYPVKGDFPRCFG